MALGCSMRVCFLALGFLLAGCATLTPESKTKMPVPSSKTLAAGECGLYVWTANAAKTFTLFASPTEIAYLKAGRNIPLTESSPTTPPSTNREFIDSDGKRLSLTLLSPQDIDGGTRYKSGRLVSLSEDGWEKVVPIVGLYACQPVA